MPSLGILDASRVAGVATRPLRFAVRLLVFAMLCSVNLPASAYRFLYPAVHEQITEAALICAAASAQAPTHCVTGVESGKASLDLSRIGLGQLTLTEARKAVSWPDDPVREIYTWWNLAGKVKWLTRMLVDHCKDHSSGIMDGLRCSSHYGPLQFMHAMEEKLEQPAGDTLAKINAWTEFSYAVATDTGGRDGLLSKNYCQYWADHPSAISGLLRPDNGKAFPCDGTPERPWTLSTLFSFTCHLQSVNCWEEVADQRRARINAIGALLHVIQDSYAKGHTERGDCCSAAALKAEVQLAECAPIRRFLVYGGQDHTRHGWGDAKYSAPDNCTPIHDPVLASATVLWHLKNGSHHAKVQEYLADHVFLLEHAANSGLGFGK